MTHRPQALAVSCVQLHWARTLEENVEKIAGWIEREARIGSRVVLFPEACITGYYFPYLVGLPIERVREGLARVRQAAASAGVYVIAGSIQRTADRFLNLAHVIDPRGEIIHEYAKVHMAGRDERRYCRGGDKLSLFEIDGIPCTLVICRDGRHPELYRIPAMAGARILLHPSCSSDEVEAVAWKRVSGRAQLPAGPTTAIFHCVANTVGQSPDGKQTSSGDSFIREPGGIPLAEAGHYQEESISAILDIERADRRYAIASLECPPFLRRHWEAMIDEVRTRAGRPPE